jgi:ferric-dicitrate binding protein FerR (iron transport regulator)
MNRFESRTRAAFDDSVEALDAHTRSRLNQARQVALAELATPSPWRRAWLPAGAFAAAAALAVGLWLGAGDPAAVQSQQAMTQPAPSLDDLAVVASDDELALLDEDPEFYAWAAAQDDGVG